MNDKFRNPENMSRKEKLALISAYKRRGEHDEAMKFWLRDCPRISRKAFDEA